MLSLNQMVIRTAKPLKTGLIGIEGKKDNLIFKHCENIEPTLKAAYLSRIYSDNGFSESREFRKIAELPASVFVIHPEFNSHPELIKEWLKTDVGRQFKACSGGI